MSRCKLLLQATLLGVFVRPAPAADWKVIREGERDYVSFANVAQFYRFPSFAQASRTVSLRGERRAIRAQAGSQEFFINGVRFFSAFPLLTEGEENLVSVVDVAKVIEPVLRPNKIRGAKKIDTVVLDPGHGGTDSGASGPRGNEKSYTLAVALTAREQLLRAGFKVELTRSGDEEISLENRVAFANRFSNAVFISIHFNSANAGSGVETYALAPAGVPSNASTENHPAAVGTHWYQGNEQDAANVALAAAVHGAILARVSVFDRGVRHARFHVLREIKIPAVLVEAGFLNDPVEGAHIATAQYRQQLGQAIAQAVTTYNQAISFQATGATLVSNASNLPPHARAITDSLGEATPASAPAPAAETPSATIQVSD